MGLTRSGQNKRKKTGGKRHPFAKKRKYHLARPPAMTRLGEKKVHLVRTMGGNTKYRGIRLVCVFNYEVEISSKLTK